MLEINVSSNKKMPSYEAPAFDQDIVPILILYGTVNNFSLDIAEKLAEQIQKPEGTKLFPRVFSMEVMIN